MLLLITLAATAQTTNPNYNAELATVVGVLIEVSVMLSLVALANKWRY